MTSSRRVVNILEIVNVVILWTLIFGFVALPLLRVSNHLNGTAFQIAVGAFFALLLIGVAVAAILVVLRKKLPSETKSPLPLDDPSNERR